MACHCVLLISLLVVLCARKSAQQLQYSQALALQQIRKQLEYPKQLDAWNNVKDLCSIPSSLSLTVTCEGSVITGLKIVGDRLVRNLEFDGYPIHSDTLSEDFSFDSFVTTLSRLNSLKVVILVSLGIWGPLSDKIHRLYSLEVLNLSSNYIYGSVPPRFSAMGMLQTLVLDGNFVNGTVPDWLSSLSNLAVLSLKNNRILGPLPKTIGAIRTLSSLSLSGNKISGELPDLSGLSSLEVLDLRENSIDSNLPAMPIGLITLLLSRNSISGEIPSQLGKLTHLQHLDLSFNHLKGPLPSELLALPNVSYLNLASNMLSGSLPKELSCSNQLGFVDISSNMFTGGLPSCLDPGSNNRIIRFWGNCLTVDSKHQREAAFCRKAEQNRTGSKGKKAWLLSGVIGVASIFLLLLSLVLVCYVKRNCYGEGHRTLAQGPELDISSTGLSTELLANARFISQKQKLGMQSLPVYRQFSLEELREATKDFSLSTYIGEGSIGKLYKGTLENGTNVAIKCLSVFKRDSVRNLKLRLDLLSKLRHPHLVCLLGNCIDKPADDYRVNRIFLIYEYVPNGHLRNLLSANSAEKALKWSDRLTILMGIAKAVHFLHTGVIPGFFNNRLKTTNVLIDENYAAKVSDYGLSIITEEIDKHEAKIEEQKTYHADQSRKLAKLEDDVYSFGFILLEMLIGPSILEKGEAFYLTELAASSTNQEGLKHILDPLVQSTSTQLSLSTVISITNKCLSPDPSSRPSIEDVLWNLQYAHQVCATAAINDTRPDATSRG